MAESGNPYWYQGQSNGSAVANTSYGVSGAAMNCTWPSASMHNPEGIDWSSVEEKAALERGLIEYAGCPDFLRNLNISLDFPNKTAREVALRLHWMEKRRGRCIKDQEKRRGRCIKDQGSKQIPLTKKMEIMEEPSVDENVLPGKELVENKRIFAQVSSNLASFQIDENVKLMAIARDNINEILGWSTKMDKSVERMPPMPVMINENLLNLILRK